MATALAVAAALAFGVLILVMAFLMEPMTTRKSYRKQRKDYD